MVKILICGCLGKMGQALCDTVKEFKEIVIVGGIDPSEEVRSDFVIFKDIKEVNIEFDILIDFSMPNTVGDNLEFLIKHKKPYVLGTTGFTKEQEKNIHNASKIIPILKSANMSLVINLIVILSKKSKNILKDNFDIEIIEKHHNQKIDAPSGTALMMASAVSDADTKFEYNRASLHSQRKKNEIGIHSIRGGDMCGEHEIMFAGAGETFSMIHNSCSRKIYARGAFKAALFLKNKPANLYNMEDILNDITEKF